MEFLIVVVYLFQFNNNKIILGQLKRGGGFLDGKKLDLPVASNQHYLFMRGGYIIPTQVIL